MERERSGAAPRYSIRPCRAPPWAGLPAQAPQPGPSSSRPWRGCCRGMRGTACLYGCDGRLCPSRTFLRSRVSSSKRAFYAIHPPLQSAAIPHGRSRRRTVKSRPDKENNPMPLSWNEIKDRALAFSPDWAEESSERGEAKSFWDAFFNVFGVSRRKETPVQAIEAAAQSVLDARAQFPGSSLADLYDPLTMPPAPTRAHQTLDRAVDAATSPARDARDSPTTPSASPSCASSTSNTPACCPPLRRSAAPQNAPRSVGVTHQWSPLGMMSSATLHPSTPTSPTPLLTVRKTSGHASPGTRRCPPGSPRCRARRGFPEFRRAKAAPE